MVVAASVSELIGSWIPSSFTLPTCSVAQEHPRTALPFMEPQPATCAVGEPHASSPSDSQVRTCRAESRALASLPTQPVSAPCAKRLGLAGAGWPRFIPFRPESLCRCAPFLWSSSPLKVESMTSLCAGLKCFSVVLRIARKFRSPRPRPSPPCHSQRTPLSFGKSTALTVTSKSNLRRRGLCPLACHIGGTGNLHPGVSESWQ